MLADPAAWASTPCTFPKSIRIDRTLTDGERFRWEETVLRARAPAAADGVRRLMTAEMLIDGQSQGPVSEALVTVVGLAGPAPGPATHGSP